MRRSRLRPRASPWRVTLLFVGYAAVHSLLASRPAKSVASRALGSRLRNGLYRFVFNVQALALFGAAVYVFVRLEDRSLYRVAAPWSWLMRAGQGAGLGLMVLAARTVGISRITGLGPLGVLLAGGEPRSEPEAQGPPLGANKAMRADGPFRYTRHPANWGPLLVVLLFPHMTANRATLAVLTMVYLVLGSVHEEVRLRQAYGPAYDRYRDMVPFLVGRPRAGSLDRLVHDSTTASPA